MKTSHVIALAATLCFSLGRWGIAADTETKSKPEVAEARAATVTGTVEAIDYNTRMVTLKDDQGRTATIEVGPEAVRFNEVKKGDKVKMDYLESVAVVVTSPGEMQSAEAAGKVIIRNKTKKPSGVAVETRVATAEVVKINAKKRTAVLKTPDGEEFPINIAPDVKNVENVKKGDKLVVKFTRSLAVSVTKE